MNEIHRYGTAGLHALLALVDGGVVLHDADGTIVAATGAAEQILRIPVLSLAGRTSVLGHLRARDPGGAAWSQSAEPAADALRTRRDAAARLARFNTPEGDEVWVELSATPVCDASTGEVRAAFTHVVDVTDRKALDRQLRGRHRLVALGRVAGSIAHDFNNLLTVILGHGDLLLGSLSHDDPARADAVAVQDAAQRAVALTRQLLAFARGSATETRVMDLNQVVLEMEPMLHRLAGSKVRLTTHIHPRPIAVYAGHAQMEQALMNLVLNSRDALPDGGAITVETGLAQLDETFVGRHAGSRRGPHALLRVSDDGCGMDAATQKRLFEPFFTTKPRDKGTGLGLATVYGTVKQGGGYVGVESSPGRGTTFSLYLPVHAGVREGVHVP